MFRPVLLAALVALCPLAPTQAADAERPFEMAQNNNHQPNVTRFPSGTYEVRYQDNCVVTYDDSARRTGSRRCVPSQVRRADRLVQEDVKDPGGGGRRFEKLANGEARVTFNDGCVVVYDDTGRRTGSRGCRPKQVRRADRVVQERF